MDGLFSIVSAAGEIAQIQQDLIAATPPAAE
jgi:hypothetical protein